MLEFVAILADKRPEIRVFEIGKRSKALRTMKHLNTALSRPNGKGERE
jgi:hypothetical protein